MAGLPEEAVMMILLRLPVKILGQCKCVSKSWRSLISDPFFVKSHLNLTISDPNIYKSSRLFMMYPYYSLDYESPSSFEAVDSNEAIVYLGSPPSKKLDGNRIELTGSCNGLICLLYHPDSFILWNPTIKQSRELPTQPVFPSYYDLRFRGFGYNSSIDDYKVVTRAPSTKANPHQFRVEVFSLKANCWRRIEDLKDSLVIEETPVGTCLHGALHWLASSRLDPYGKGVIVSLDLGTEKFKEIPIPDWDDKNGTNSFFELGMLNGSLSLLSEEGGIWVMKEYGVKASWTKVLVLPRGDDMWCEHWWSPVCFTSNGDLVVATGGEAVRYNPKEKTMRYLKARCYGQEMGTILLYVESLVSPNGY